MILPCHQLDFVVLYYLFSFQPLLHNPACLSYWHSIYIHIHDVEVFRL